MLLIRPLLFPPTFILYFFLKSVFCSQYLPTTMTEIILYAIGAFILGFVIAWLIKSNMMVNLKKELKNSESLLSQEKQMKETQRKESNLVQQHQQAKELSLIEELNQKKQLLKRLDEDILLLQRSNEETEEMLKASQPELHAMKLKLIEAQNTIARYKSKLGTK